MPDFKYKAITENGETIAGVIEADSIEMASDILSAQGYIPSKVEEHYDGQFGGLWTTVKSQLNSVKAEELILFTKQFRTMLMAGLPILEVLKILEQQIQNIKLKKAIISIGVDIRGGSTLSRAFGKHTKIFSGLYANMIKAGESSGTLPEVLKRLIYILEHEEKVRSDIRAALQYPITVVVALGIAFFVLLTFVVPKFVTIFNRAGLKLPLPTKICLYIYNFFSAYWLLIAIVMFAGLFSLIFYLKTQQGIYVRDKLILKIPLLGHLFIKTAMSRFASIFSILQASGISVIAAMQILAGTIGNAAVSRELEHVKERIEEGRGISAPLRSSKYFTPMVVNMVAIGEESGELDEMLRQISVHYDDEVEYAVKRLSDAIGPILVVSLAAVVGFFALAIFLPMWDLTKMVS